MSRLLYCTTIMEFETMDLLSEMTEQNDQRTSFLNNNLINQTNKHIQLLYEKYENDDYMVSKIYHYVSQQLPQQLLSIHEARQRSLAKREKNEKEQEKFMSRFLNQSKYFYYPTNEMFYMYDGENYCEKSEDDILYDIVSSITQADNDDLQNWKHKTKVSVLKRIKEHHLFTAIPESVTIQRVVSALYPAIFSKRSEAKYFLAILGDNLQKRNGELIHFIPSYAGPFLKEINRKSLLMLSQHCTATFKTKCHEKHYEGANYESCRNVPISSSVSSEHFWKTFLAENSLNLFCVACHYSNRYQDSNKYVVQFSNDSDLHNYVFKIPKHPLPLLFSRFCDEFLFIHQDNDSISTESCPFWECSPQESFLSTVMDNETTHAVITNSDIHLTWKHMFYLWKYFLRTHKYPSNLYSTSCKNQAIEIFRDRYNETNDAFEGIGSSQLPVIQKFLRFWDETMIEESNENNVLKIDEVASLFRKWLSQSSDEQRHFRKEKFLLNDSKIVDILNYYKNQIEIEDSKYLYNFRNILWDKESEMMDCIEIIRDKIRASNNEDTHYVTIDDMYSYYTSSYSKVLTVTKPVFEKFVREKYRDCLENDYFVKEKLM